MLVFLLLAAQVSDPPAAPAARGFEIEQAAPATQEPLTLVAGPMVGHVASHRARIWAQGSHNDWFLVEVSADGEHWQRSIAANGREARAWFAPERELCAVYEVSNLQPATHYRYRLVTRDGVLAAEVEQSFVTPPAAGTAESFQLAFGSCAGEWGDDPSQPVFRAIDAAHPEVFLWLGDNLYFELPDREWSEEARMARRWREQRAKGSLRGLLARTSHYAIWDDHDYGPDNSDKLYPLRDESLRLFTNYWANPAYGSDGLRGVWHRFQRGRVEFFLLDSRYHRDPNFTEPDAHKTQFGETQWRWLETGLVQSRADFKVVVSSTQVLARYHEFESWRHFPADRRRLLRILRERRVSGVLLLSGDRHTGEALVWRPPLAPYPLYEFTASPLAAGIGLLVPDEQATDRIAGTGVAQEHFGMLRFDFDHGTPKVHFQSHDVAGRPLHDGVTVSLDRLQLRD